MTAHTTLRRALAGALIATLAIAGATQAQIVNGSFETGNFNGWIMEETLHPHVPMEVVPAGVVHPWVSMLVTAPTDGQYLARNGFDACMYPGYVSLAQDFGVPEDRALLLFDYRAKWKEGFVWSSQERTFSVLLQPEGGGPSLHSFVPRRVASSEAGETGFVTAGVDLSEFRGSNVRIVFQWVVPTTEPGWSDFHLDNVRLVGSKVDPLERASLFVKLDFPQRQRDQLRLQLEVPVGPGFYPAGEPVTVHVGNMQRSFGLDHKGRGATGDATLSLRPEKLDPLYRKLLFRVRAANLLAALTPFGLADVDTPKAGVTVEVPVRVELDGITTEGVLLVVYKATKTRSGVARGKVAADCMDTSLAIRLDFKRPERDTLTLRGLVPAGTGFLPEGRGLMATVGHTKWGFKLDKYGKGSNDGATVLVKRDRRNPALWIYTLRFKKGDLAAQFVADGLTNQTTPKPGVALRFPVRVTLDSPTCEPLMEMKYQAKFDVFGKAKGVF
jgi:hypothetical protein